MPRRGRLPRGLVAGGALIGILAFFGIAAPFVATDRPLLARGPDGWSSPAARSAFGLPDAPAGRSATAVVMAPIPRAPETIQLDSVLAPPGPGHWLGTDGLGRDVGSRLVHGARVSLAVGFLSAALALLVGLPLGALAGWSRGPIDAAVSRGVEAMLCFPSLLLALALLASSPPWLSALPDSVRLALVLGITGWTPAARYVRAEFLKLGGSALVDSARASGAGSLRIAVRHVLPHAAAPVLVTASFSVGSAILLEASLSFLGLGVRPPTPTWGGLLTEAAAHLERGWWLALLPGAALFLSVLGCNLAGEGLRDRLDPRSRP